MKIIHLYVGAQITVCALMRWDKARAKPVYRQIRGEMKSRDGRHISVRCTIDGQDQFLWVSRDKVVA